MNLKTGALAFLVALAAAMPNPDVHREHSDITGHDHRGHPKHKSGKHFEELNHTKTRAKPNGVEHLNAKRTDGVYGFYECSLPDWKGDCHWTQIKLGEDNCYNAQYQGKGSFGPDRDVLCTMYQQPNCAEQGYSLSDQTFPGLKDSCPNSLWGAGSTNCPASYNCVAVVVGDVAMKTPHSKREVGQHLGAPDSAETDPEPDGLELLRAKRTALVSATNVTLEVPGHGKVKRDDGVYGFYECSEDNFKGQCHWTQIVPNVVQCFNPTFGTSQSFGPDPGVSCVMYSVNGCSDVSYVSKPLKNPGVPNCKAGKFWKWGNSLSPCAQSWSCAVTAVGNADPMKINIFPGYGNGEQTDTGVAQPVPSFQSGGRPF